MNLQRQEIHTHQQNIHNHAFSKSTDDFNLWYVYAKSLYNIYYY